MNTQNLINLKDRTPEERHEIVMKSVESRRKNAIRRKSMGELGEILLKKNISAGLGTKPEDFEDLATLIDKNIDAGTAIMLSQIRKAVDGDTQAAIFVRDTVGDKNAEKVETGIRIEDYVREHKPKF